MPDHYLLGNEVWNAINQKICTIKVWYRYGTKCVKKGAVFSIYIPEEMLRQLATINSPTLLVIWLVSKAQKNSHTTNMRALLHFPDEPKSGAIWYIN